MVRTGQAWEVEQVTKRKARYVAEFEGPELRNPSRTSYSAPIRLQKSPSRMAFLGVE